MANGNIAGLLYNLYADRELNLNLVPQSVYDMQSTFYRTVENTYGVPLDTRHNYTKGTSYAFPPPWPSGFLASPCLC
jgi:hypothetical protein